MIESTIDQVQKNCLPGEWGELQLAREEKLNSHKHSVVVESSFLEMDSVESWLCTNVGARELAWNFYFFYKESYDYGYVEYFFLDEAHLQKFKSEVPRFFGVGADGRKFRTNGWNVLLDLE